MAPQLVRMNRGNRTMRFATCTYLHWKIALAPPSNSTYFGFFVFSFHIIRCYGACVCMPTLMLSYLCDLLELDANKSLYRKYLKPSLKTSHLVMQNIQNAIDSCCCCLYSKTHTAQPKIHFNFHKKSIAFTDRGEKKRKEKEWNGMMHLLTYTARERQEKIKIV